MVFSASHHRITPAPLDAPQCWALPFFPFSPRLLLPQQRRKRPLLRAIAQGLKGSKSIGWMAINGASSISFMAAGVQCLWNGKMVGFHGKIMDVFYQSEDFGGFTLFSVGYGNIGLSWWSWWGCLTCKSQTFCQQKWWSYQQNQKLNQWPYEDWRLCCFRAATNLQFSWVINHGGWGCQLPTIH